MLRAKYIFKHAWTITNDGTRFCRDNKSIHFQAAQELPGKKRKTQAGYSYCEHTWTGRSGRVRSKERCGIKNEKREKSRMDARKKKAGGLRWRQERGGRGGNRNVYDGIEGDKDAREREREYQRHRKRKRKRWGCHTIIEPIRSTMFTKERYLIGEMLVEK